MLRSTVYYILFLAAALTVHGQSKDKEQCSILINRSEKLCEKPEIPGPSNDSAAAFASQALRISKQTHDLKVQGRCYLVLSKTSQIDHQYIKGKEYALQAIEIFKTIPDYQDLGESCVMAWSNQTLNGLSLAERVPWLQKAADAFEHAGNKSREADCDRELGDILFNMGRLEDALAVLQTSLRLYKETKYPHLQSVYDLLGVTYSMLGEYDNAVQYGLLAVKTAESLNDTSLSLCTYYNRIGSAYRSLNDTANSRIFYRKALDIAMKYKDLSAISALAHSAAKALVAEGRPKAALALVDDVVKKFPEVLREGRAPIDLVQISAYRAAGEYSKALPAVNYIEEQMARGKLDERELAQAYSTLIPFYIDRQDYDKAEKYVQKLKPLSVSLRIRTLYSDWFKLRYRVDSAKKDYRSALINYRQYKTIQDSLFNETKSRQIAHYSILYETEKKDKDLQMLKKETELQQSNLRQAASRQKFSLGIMGLLLVIAGLLCYGFVLKRRSNRTLISHQDQINGKNEKLQRLVVEKDWVMKEIHHRVKNNLHMVAGLLASQTEFIKGKEAMHVISESQHRVQSMAILHQRLYQTENLSSIDMCSYISELTDYLQSSVDRRSGVRFVLDIERLEFPLSHSIPIGLILNEVITNSLKYAFPHSNGGSIGITLKKEQVNEYRLTMRDNGIGMPQDTDPEKHTSLGMTLIKGLSDDIQAALSIYNDNGVCVELLFGLPEVRRSFVITTTQQAQ